MRLLQYIKEAGFSKFPEGWTSDSVKSWVKTFMKNHKIPASGEGFFDACVISMSDKMGEEGAKRFCSSAKDEFHGTAFWRGKGGKSKKELSTAKKEHPLHDK